MTWLLCESEYIDDGISFGFVYMIENKITGGALRALVPSVQTLRLTSTILEVVITTDDTISHAEVTIKMEVGCATTEGVSSSLI